MHKHIVRHIVSYIIIFIVVLFCVREFIVPGVPQTHDAQYHLGRVAAFFQAVKDGHLPPRWGGNLNLGFGYPVFNFNYPLGNIMAVPYQAIGFTVETSFKLVYITAYIVGGLGYYLWLSGHFRRSEALYGAIVYLTTPFWFLNMFVRGAFGEVNSLALLPWVMWAVDRIVREPALKNFGLLSAFFGTWLLSHNVSVLIASPIIALYGVATLVISIGGATTADGKKLNHRAFARKNFIKLFAISGAVILGISLSLWFWLPAIMEKQFTILETIPSNVSFPDHYPTIVQLIWSRWGYGLSVPGPGDDMSFGLGELQLLTLVTGTYLVFKQLRKKSTDILPTVAWLMFTIVLAGWTAIVLMNQLSYVLARYIPLINYLQHPWRLLQITTLAAGFAAAYVLARQAKQLPWWILLAGFLIYSLPRTQVSVRFSNPELYYERFPLTTSGEEENLPIWFDQAKNYKLKPRIKFLEEGGIFEIDAWKTTRHVYRINVPQNTRVVEHTAYFPGWTLTLDGNETAIDYQYKDYPGLITFSVIKGDHTILTEFRDTPVRRIANTLSILAAAAIILALGTWRLIAQIAVYLRNQFKIGFANLHRR